MGILSWPSSLHWWLNCLSPCISMISQKLCVLVTLTNTIYYNVFICVKHQGNSGTLEAKVLRSLTSVPSLSLFMACIYFFSCIHSYIRSFTNSLVRLSNLVSTYRVSDVRLDIMETKSLQILDTFVTMFPWK